MRKKIYNRGSEEVKEKSRTEYSMINTSIAFVAQILAIFMGFITRVVFTHTLSIGYVGINGLFTDILNILSLSELGAGTAITYALYGPIARRDIRKQKILMRIFRSFYRITALVVLAAGLCLIPFLHVLIKERPDVDHLVLIYLLYLLNSVVSYLVIYKRTLVDAHQMNYITVLYHHGFLILQDVLQIIILCTTGNFLLFLLVAVICTITGNMLMSRRAERMFPYLKEPCKERLPLEEGNGLLRNVRAMLMHKVGSVVINNTDNLILSGFVGVVSAGIYSNYFLIIGSIRQVLDQAFQGVAASVGNLGVTEDGEKSNQIFRQLFFVCQWMYGLAGICLLELLNPFIELAFGKQYLFKSEIVIILCVNFFLTGTRKAVLIFKESMGLFWYDRYKAVLEAGLNLVLSLLLVQKAGVAGVFLGTLLSMLLTSVWVEPYILYRHQFEKSAVSFFAAYAGMVGIMAGIWGITHCICHLCQWPVFWNLLFRLAVCLVLPNTLLWLIYGKCREAKLMMELFSRMWQRFLSVLANGKKKWKERMIRK